MTKSFDPNIPPNEGVERGVFKVIIVRPLVVLPPSPSRKMCEGVFKALLNLVGVDFWFGNRMVIFYWISLDPSYYLKQLSGD